MGCTSSKLDDLPAVVLCRERVTFLDQALHQRWALSETHVSYTLSLHSVGLSLRSFFNNNNINISLPAPTVTLQKDLPTPPPDHDPPKRPSGGHLEFHSSSSDDDLSDHHDHHHDEHHMHDIDDSDDDHDDGGYHLQPEGSYGNFQHYYNGNGNNGNGQQYVNYMKRHVTPSVSYQQRPFSSETVQFGTGYPGGTGTGTTTSTDPSSSTSFFHYYNNNQNTQNNNYAAAPPVGGNNSYNYGSGGGGGGGYYGGFTVASSSKERVEVVPPPPPPAPVTSTWDFLNPFESIESVYPPAGAAHSYTPSRDSREVREEEGIPELEVDEVYDHFGHYGGKGVVHEVVKEVDEGRKSEEREGKAREVPSSSEDEEEGGGEGESSDPVEYEVHMVDKKVVGEEGSKKSKKKGEEREGKGGSSGGGGGFKNVFEVVQEIQVQFEKASACGSELDKVLEVGKLRYQRKNTAYQVSSKMLNVIPSLPSNSRDSEGLGVDEEVQLRSVNLSATLQKLFLWEKKLLDEVKSEEKMRVLHDRKVQKLKRLDEKGAEVQKIDSTRSIVRNLSTKIRIAIQIVDKISVKISKLRDDELWPQLIELLQGLCRMWRAMLECHHNQCLAIDGARGLDAIAFPQDPSDTQLEAILQLEHDLINWTCKFTEWVGAQRGFVRALNSWLLKCLLEEPEETADGIAPFSPGRAGAPPIFVICHQWNQSLERISETSEKEAIDSMRMFAMLVWHFRERDKGELRQRMTANKDIERKVKNLEREDTKMQKEIHAFDKKLVLSSGGPEGLSLSDHVVYQSDTSKTSLQAGLRHVFEALDRFTADSVKVYEELLQRSEEVVQGYRRDS